MFVQHHLLEGARWGLQSLAKYIWNLLGFTENFDLK